MHELWMIDQSFDIHHGYPCQCRGTSMTWWIIYELRYSLFIMAHTRSCLHVRIHAIGTAAACSVTKAQQL